jgi:hypothetical protein
MRKYNIIEYKSPKDGMNIDDFYKTNGYACLYKGYGKKVNEIPMQELTVSMFRAKHPRKLFTELKREGYKIEKKYPGIYYVTGNLPFPAQIVVTSELDPETHSSLRILTDHADIEDVKHFLTQTSRMTEQEDKNNINAVLQASASANQDVYDDIRRDAMMCQALRELMKDEIDAEINAAVNDAVNSAVSDATNKAETASKLEDIRNIMKNFKCTVEQAMDALEIPQQNRAMYLSKL